MSQKIHIRIKINVPGTFKQVCRRKGNKTLTPADEVVEEVKNFRMGRE
jgi:hypothetical protein